MCWRRLQDVLKINKYLLGYFKTRKVIYMKFQNFIIDSYHIVINNNTEFSHKNAKISESLKILIKQEFWLIKQEFWKFQDFDIVSF